MDINIPVVNAPYLDVSGLQLSWASNTTLTMQAGVARNSSNQADIMLPLAVTINGAHNGINGLDTGVLVLNTLYTIYAVGDSTNNHVGGAVLSASAVAPTLPVGYDMWRAIGYVRTDASVHFLLGYWYGNANDRLFTYDVPIATAVTAGASATYAAVTLATFVPALPNLPVLIEANWTANAANDTLALQGFAAVGDTVKYIAPVAGATAHTIVRDYVNAMLNSGAPEINYKVSAAAVALNVAGYMYSI